MGASRPKILIVEDEPRLREFLERASSSMDFDPIPVRAAELALKVLDEQSVQVAILDLTLPGMGGLELLEAMRQRQIDIPVIILTGYGDLESAQSAIRLEVVDFLTKPCSLKELDAALSRSRKRMVKGHFVPVEPIVKNPPAQTGSTPQGTLEELERDHIFAALRAQNGNRAAAAVQLGISERTLYYRLSRYQQQGVLPDDCRQR